MTNQFLKKRFIGLPANAWSYGTNYHPDYFYVHSQPNADSYVGSRQAVGYQNAAAQYQPDPEEPPIQLYSIGRGAVGYDLSEIPSDIEIDRLIISRLFQFKQFAPSFYGFVYDATSLEYDEYGNPTSLSNYGLIRDLTTPLGSCFFPYNEYFSTGYTIELNEAGKQYIKDHIGGPVWFAVRISTDVDQQPPPFPTIEGFGIREREGGHPINTLLFNPTEGYIWIEWTKLAYLDAFRAKRLIEGTEVGEPLMNPIGYIWVHGTDLFYRGTYPFYNRKITGTLTGLTGKRPGQISINGTKFCYIDQDGNERYIQGERV